MMNKAAEKWVTTLFAEKYSQGTGCLRDEHNQFDVLGVACDLYQINHGDLSVSKHRFQNIDGTWEEVWSYDGRLGGLPDKVVNWLGLTTSCGEYYEEVFLEGKKHKQPVSLAGLNDSGFTFQNLAVIIASEPEGLFVADTV